MGGLRGRGRPSGGPWAGEHSVAYAELHARSAFSMLDGASTPEQLARHAADIGLETVALTDLDDLGGVVRFDEACEEHGIRPIVGAELSLMGSGPVVLLCEDRAGYANLCRLVTEARTSCPRGEPAVTVARLGELASGLVCLTGGREGALDMAQADGGDEAALALALRLREAFGDRLYVEVQDHGLSEDVRRIGERMDLAARLDAAWIVTSDARHARARDKPTHDALLCLKAGRTVELAGDLLFPNDQRRLVSPAQVSRIWRSAPAGVVRTLEVAERCRFRIREVRPTLPRFPLPEGVTDADAFLEALVRDGMRARIERATPEHERQVRHELDVIRNLGLAGYFLIVWDIVRFSQSARVLVQGRGSAANSTVCFCLGITAIDPVRHGLLFERFLSESRGEAPDIDLDLAHRDREKVIQYVYDRYGRRHAAMVCEVVTWRARSAVCDAARVLGLPAEVGNRLAGQVGSTVPTDAAAQGSAAAADDLLEGGFGRAGIDGRDGRMRALVRLLRGLEGLPRHRSIHVGGFVLTGEPLCTVVPIEPASMEGRTVIQWDKDDLGPVGLVKIDLLGLGMLTLLSDAAELVRKHRGARIDLARLPPDDPDVYAMIRRADTVGLFQIESRAQMSVLPRKAPERFYDLVVQVALVRPGPIQGEMVHPYLRRRRGQEPVAYLHPCLEPVLERTLGVPLFQEQGMRVAIVAAGFTPGQADELRRTMGSKRSKTRMARLALELLRGMQTQGIARDVAERIVKQLAAFASYGFPESHAASFALLVYASAYLKHHYAPEFYAAILNAQPMGFYPVGTLVADARRHGVEVRRPDIARSAWDTILEASDRAGQGLALRLGLRLVRGLGPRARVALERTDHPRPVTSVAELARRTGLPPSSLRLLAAAGALDSVAGDRRRALWEVLRISRGEAGPLAPMHEQDPRPTTLPALGERERVMQDYASTGACADRHPMELVRDRMDRAGVTRSGSLHERPKGTVRVAGLVISRQRPATAKGFVFLALEDETGIVNVIVEPRLFAAQRSVVAHSAALVVEGDLERRDDVVNVKARRLRALRIPTQLADGARR